MSSKHIIGFNIKVESIFQIGTILRSKPLEFAKLRITKLYLDGSAEEIKGQFSLAAGDYVEIKNPVRKLKVKSKRR